MRYLPLILICLGFLGIGSVFAGDKVFVTKNGKHYHTHSDCIALKGKEVKEILIATAGAKNLTLCSICARRRSSVK